MKTSMVGLAVLLLCSSAVSASGPESAQQGSGIAFEQCCNDRQPGHLREERHEHPGGDGPARRGRHGAEAGQQHARLTEPSISICRSSRRRTLVGRGRVPRRREARNTPPPFGLVAPSSDRLQSSGPATRKWRNWQTHRLQEPAGATLWGFKSPLPHQAMPRGERDDGKRSPPLSRHWLRSPPGRSRPPLPPLRTGKARNRRSGERRTRAGARP